MHFPTVASSDYATATNAAATVTYAANANARHNITHVLFGYSATPTAGSITITVGGTLVSTIPVTAAGAGFLPIQLGGKTNQAVVVTLTDGGAAVVGYITVGHTIDT